MVYRALLLFLVTLLLPSTMMADSFTAMGTRWPAGLKKTITGKGNTLFVANGDILAAYDESNLELQDQIEVDTPEGILCLRPMPMPTPILIAAACGTGGLQVFKYDANALGTKITCVTKKKTSSVARGETTGDTRMDIKAITIFKDSDGSSLIGAADENYGIRIFEYTTSNELSEVSQKELIEENGELIIDMETWVNPSNPDFILAVSKNRSFQAYTVANTTTGGFDAPVKLYYASLPLPRGTPTAPLFDFSTFALSVSGSRAHIVENTLGNLFSFNINSTGAILDRTYPPIGQDGITFGYPIDIVSNHGYAFITTLVTDKDKIIPGVQVVDLNTYSIEATHPIQGASALYLDGETLTTFDMVNGLSLLDVTSPTPTTEIDNSVLTPFSAAELISFLFYLLVPDGIKSPTGGFRVINIDNPTIPMREAFVQTAGQALDMAITGDGYRLFVADGHAGVQCYAATDAIVPADTAKALLEEPASIRNPIYIETLDADLLGGDAIKATITEKSINDEIISTLHVLTNAPSLVSFPLPASDGPPHVDRVKKEVLPLDGAAKEIAPFLKDYVLVAGGDQGFLIVDLYSDIENPTRLSPGIDEKARYRDGLTNTVSVTSDGSRYAYIADDTAQIVSFDLFSDQNNPAAINLKKVGEYTPDGIEFTDLFATTNNNLYLISNEKGHTVQILDISKPDAIVENNTQTTGGTPKAIIAAATKALPGTPSIRAAYIADGQGGVAIRQSTDASNQRRQIWKDDEASCFITSSAEGH